MAHTTIKTTLKSFCKKDFVGCDIINDAVVRMHHLTTEVYQFMRLYIIHCVDNDVDISSIITNNDNNNVFIRDCYVLLCDQTGQKGKRGSINSSLVKFYDKIYKQIKPTKTISCKNLSFVRNEEATQISTAYLNNIKFNFYSRLLKLVKKVFKFTRKDNYTAHNIVSDLLTLTEEPKSDKAYTKWIKENRGTYVPVFSYTANKFFVAQEKYKKAVVDFTAKKPDMCKKDILKKFSSIKPIHPYYYDLYNHSMNFQKPMIFISKTLENLGVKNIQAIPCRTAFTPKTIKFTTNALYDLFEGGNFSKHFKETQIDNIDKEFKKILKTLTKEEQKRILALTKIEKRKEKEYKNLYKKKLKIYEKKYWSTHFNIDKFEKKKKNKNFVFKGILTNGFSVSIFFENNKLSKETIIPVEQKDPEEIYQEFKYVDDLTKIEKEKILNGSYFSIDPGVNSLITTVNATGEVYSYTRQRRRVEAYHKRSKQIRVKTLTKNIKTKIEQLSKHSSKSCIYENYKQYIKKRQECETDLYNHHKNMLYRKLQFRSHVQKEKSEAKMIKELKEKYTKEGKPLTALYGDWSRPRGIKCGPPVPGIGLRRLFRKSGINVYLVDEHRTSKVTHCCKGEWEHPLTRENPKPYKTDIKPIHSLLRCKNVKCNKYWNRDVMAGKNILEKAECILRDIPIPVCFQRKPLKIKPHTDVHTKI